MPKLIPLPQISEFILEDFMIPMNLNARDLSEGTNIPLPEIFAILNNVAEITPEISKKLASFFGVSSMLFYNIQNNLKARHQNEVKELQYA